MIDGVFKLAEKQRVSPHTELIYIHMHLYSVGNHMYIAVAQCCSLFT